MTFLSFVEAAAHPLQNLNLPNGPMLWHEILSHMAPGAIVAGGAVRDFLLGVEPKDIDVFMPAGDAFDAPGFLTGLDGDKAAEYEAMGTIQIVLRGYVGGRQVDVVGVDPWPEKLVDTFDFGISRSWFDGKRIHDTPEAKADRENKTITLLLTERLERSRARFARFNERMGGDWRLIENAGV